MLLFFVAFVRADDLEQKSTDSSPWLERRILLEHKIMSMQHNFVPNGLDYEDAVKHPLIYWRAWANQRLPFMMVALLLLGTLIPIRLICPNFVARAQIQYEQRWARSLGLGLLFLIFGGCCGGFLARSGLFAPLATVTIAAIQLIALFGLSVAADSIGRGALSILRLDKRLKANKFNNLLPLCLGILLCSLLVLIPGFSLLPGLGNRLLALIAAAGTGAVLVSIKKATQPDGN
jgi:hypothetical protein